MWEIFSNKKDYAHMIFALKNVLTFENRAEYKGIGNCSSVDIFNIKDAYPGKYTPLQFKIENEEYIFRPKSSPASTPNVTCENKTVQAFYKLLNKIYETSKSLVGGVKLEDGEVKLDEFSGLENSLKGKIRNYSKKPLVKIMGKFMKKVTSGKHKGKFIINTKMSLENIKKCELSITNLEEKIGEKYKINMDKLKGTDDDKETSGPTDLANEPANQPASEPANYLSHADGDHLEQSYNPDKSQTADEIGQLEKHAMLISGKGGGYRRSFKRRRVNNTRRPRRRRGGGGGSSRSKRRKRRRSKRRKRSKKSRRRRRR